MTRSQDLRREAPGAPRRVLVVDDNRDLADGLSWILEAEGMEVETAYTAEEALEKTAATADFDVVVLDFKLPGLTGFAARRAIRERLPGARCLTMSGWSVDQLLAQTLGVERVRVVRHPLSTAGLASLLDALAAGGVLMVLGSGDESARRLAAQLRELDREAVVIGDPASARSLVDGPEPVLVLDLARPIVEALDLLFELLDIRPDDLCRRRVVLHARPLAPATAADQILASQASTGLLVKPTFDFDDVLRMIRGSDL